MKVLPKRLCSVVQVLRLSSVALFDLIGCVAQCAGTSAASEAKKKLCFTSKSDVIRSMKEEKDEEGKERIGRSRREQRT